MKRYQTIHNAYACILAILITSPAFADSKIIDSMNITGGSVIWSDPVGNSEEIVFSTFGANTNLVNGYIGVGGSTSEPSTPPDPDNIILFTILGDLNNVVAYTAASNLGSTTYPADTIVGGPVPTGAVDDDLNTIQMDLSSWFVNLNNITDIWTGTGQDDGVTSPLASGTWNPDTFEYELSWSSMVPADSPFSGIISIWTLTGYAYPVSTISITIDIKPDSDQNTINLRSHGVIPVAILSTVDFDATTIDPASVNLAEATVKMAGKSGKYLCSVEDTNYDGLDDLLCKIETVELVIEPGQSTVVMEALTYDGQMVRGEAQVEVLNHSNIIL